MSFHLEQQYGKTTQLSGGASITQAQALQEALHELQVHQIELEIQNEALRESQSNLEIARDNYIDLYDFAPVSYFSLDTQGLIVKINHTAALLFAIDRNKLMQFSFDKLVFVDDLVRWRAFFRRGINEQLDQNCVISLKVKQEKITLDLFSRFRDGQLRITLIDRTEQLQVERKLLETERQLDFKKHEQVEMARVNLLRYQALFEHSSLALLTFIPPFWQIGDANKASMQLFGIATCNEFSQLNVFDLFRSNNIFEDKLDAAILTGSCVFEWQCQRKDLSLFFVNVILSRVDSGEKQFLLASVTDITESRNKALEVKKYQELLRELASEGVSRRERELKSIAREIHDDLGQVLTALRMEVALLRIQFLRRNANFTAKIQDINTLIDHAIFSVRNVAGQLRPPVLDAGLEAAIHWLCDNLPKTVDVAVEIAPGVSELADAQLLAIFRIIQESLTNMVRYAEATQVQVKIWKVAAMIYATITDNGKGFDTQALRRKNSYGLIGMNERAYALGGEVDFKSTLEKGTVVTVRIPYL